MKEEEIDKLTDEILEIVWDHKFDVLDGNEYDLEVGREIKAILTTVIGDNMNKRCVFFDHCELASITSKACVIDGGGICDLYRELSKRGEKRKSWFSRLVKDATK